jgi:hypothetical protein
MLCYAVLGLAVALVLGISGCSSGSEIEAELSDEDRIREAVYRYQFADNVSGLGASASFYFLRVEGGGDPSSRLLEQFAGQTPAVKPVSASTLEAGTAQVVDRESRLPGLIFEIDEIRWLGGDEVEVEGGYEEASESAVGSVFRLAKEDGHWRVVSSQMLWIK